MTNTILFSKESDFFSTLDKKGLSGLLQDRDILLNGSIQIPSFLSAMERESFQYLYKAGAQEHMAVAEKASYYLERDR